MKRTIHRGWLYIVSIALSLLGVLGGGYTSSAQVLWVLGVRVDNPLHKNASNSQSGNDLSAVESWNGEWTWDCTTHTLLIKDLKSNKPIQGIQVRNIPNFTIRVEGECSFENTIPGKSVIEASNCPISIEGVGAKAALFIKTPRDYSSGIRIARKHYLMVSNCYVNVSSRFTFGIVGEGNGDGVGIRLSNDGSIEAKGRLGAIEGVKEYIQVNEGGDWVNINESQTYARTTEGDVDVAYLSGQLVDKATGETLSEQWVLLAPYFPISIGELKLHKYRTKLTPERYGSVVKSGEVLYNPEAHVLRLNAATIASEEGGGISSHHSDKLLRLVCAGSNKITTNQGPCIKIEDAGGLSIEVSGNGAALELVPAASDRYPGIWDDSHEGELKIRDIDLTIASTTSCIGTSQQSKRLSLSNLNASLTTTSNDALIDGFSQLTLEKAFVKQPLGAVVAGGTIRQSDATLRKATCVIQRGSAPAFHITFASNIRHGRVEVTNYSGSLTSVPFATHLKIKATADAGYHLTKIFAGSENITNTKEFVVTRNTEISAQFEANEYNVSSAPSEGGSISLSRSGIVPYGTEVVVTVTPNLGYRLLKLWANGVDITEAKRFVVQGATTVEASFQPESYAVSAKVPQHGEILLSHSGLVSYGTEVSVTVRANEGYSLVKLMANGVDITATKKFVVKEATMVEALFDTEGFTVRAKESKHGKITLSYSGQVPRGTEVLVTAFPDQGYELVRLTANGEVITETKSFIVKTNTVVEATFRARSYMVTVVSPQHGHIYLSHNGLLPYGTEVTVTDRPNANYELAKLTANGVDITKTKKFLVLRATMVEAYFKKTSAIEEVASSEGRLYPNPASKATTLTGVEPGTMVQLLSLDGAEVLRTLADEAGVARLDLTGLAAGKYLVRSGKTTTVLLVAK